MKASEHVGAGSVEAAAALLLEASRSWGALGAQGQGELVEGFVKTGTRASSDRSFSEASRSFRKALELDQLRLESNDNWRLAPLLAQVALAEAQRGFAGEATDVAERTLDVVTRRENWQATRLTESIEHVESALRSLGDEPRTTALLERRADVFAALTKHPRERLRLGPNTMFLRCSSLPRLKISVPIAPRRKRPPLRRRGR